MKPYIINRYKSLVAISIIVAATFATYLNVFHAGFISWDDGDYTFNNSNIRTFSFDNIKAWFTNFYVGNYHPLTMASYAIDYLIGKSEPATYHTTNILLHTINACLVYRFIKQLNANYIVAFWVALLFALHPSQTESVSWISERKTVLSGLFSLWAMICYTSENDTPHNRKIILVTILACFAMLCKASAVAIPFSLIAIDLWTGKNLKDKKIWLDKIPVTIAAVITGLMAISAQKHGGFLTQSGATGSLYSILYAGYAYTAYIIHVILPVNLSAIYPYPKLPEIKHFLALAATCGIILLSVHAARKQWRMLLGCIIFFTANIIPVLQFIRFGEAIIADRYLYMASLGIFIPLAHYLYQLLHNKRNIFITIAASVTLLLSILSFNRNYCWQSDMNFYTALLQTFPNSSVAHSSIGTLYMQQGNLDLAEIHLNKATQSDPENYKAWHSKGAMHMRQGRAMEALESLNRSIAIYNYPKAYFSRAMLHLSTGRSDLALSDINQVLSTQPGNARAWYIQGACLSRSGKISEAIESYSRALSIDRSEPLYYIGRGKALIEAAQFNRAAEDLKIAIQQQPRNGECYYFLGLALQGNKINPCAAWQKAISLGYKNAETAWANSCR